MPGPPSLRDNRLLPPPDDRLAPSQQFLRDWQNLGLQLPSVAGSVVPTSMMLGVDRSEHGPPAVLIGSRATTVRPAEAGVSTMRVDKMPMKNLRQNAEARANRILKQARKSAAAAESAAAGAKIPKQSRKRTQSESRMSQAAVPLHLNNEDAQARMTEETEEQAIRIEASIREQQPEADADYITSMLMNPSGDAVPALLASDSADQIYDNQAQYQSSADLHTQRPASESSALRLGPHRLRDMESRANKLLKRSKAQGLPVEGNTNRSGSKAKAKQIAAAQRQQATMPSSIEEPLGMHAGPNAGAKPVADIAKRGPSHAKASKQGSG